MLSFSKVALLFLGVSLSACAGVKTETSSAAAPSLSSDYFTGLKGCFLLYNMKTGAFDKVIGEEVCKERFPACSTFKVPLAVMAFDSGVLKDENVVYKWDGKSGMRPEEKRDQNAKTWMRDSVVWFSQRLTPQLGAKRVQKYLDGFEYGNRDMSAGLTQAWLVSPSKNAGLKISAYEQVEFMKKLWTDSLPVSKRAMKLTREITYLETSPKGFVLNGKTGSGFYDSDRKLNFGWFIAHLQKGDQEYIAVANLSDLKPSEEGYGGPRAKAVVKRVFGDLGLW